MNQIPHVSIVIPCYNRALLIADAIASAVANGDGAEIVVVDDGSTDGSWDCIRAFGDRVRSFRTANRGVSAARNFGVDQATGTHVKFLDSDDRLPAGAIAGLVEAQRTLGPHQIAFGDARSIGPAGEPIESFGYGFADVAVAGPLPQALLLARVMSPYLPLYPIGVLRQVGGFDPAYSLGEDQELAVRIVLAGFEFHRIPGVVAEVREHPGERLSRARTAAFYGQLAFLYESIVHHFSGASQPLAPDEALALARAIWTVARDAARDRHRAQALRLFTLATDLTGSTQAAPKRLRPLYRFINPYRVERFIDFIKSLSGS